MSTIEITPIKYDDIPGAAECIQVAFGEDDPYFHWAFDPDKVSLRKPIIELRTPPQGSSGSRTTP